MSPSRPCAGPPGWSQHEPARLFTEVFQAQDPFYVGHCNPRQPITRETTAPRHSETPVLLLPTGTVQVEVTARESEHGLGPVCDHMCHLEKVRASCAAIELYKGCGIYGEETIAGGHSGCDELLANSRNAWYPVQIACPGIDRLG